MEKLHHELWIVHAINVIFGPIAAAILRALGREVPAHGNIIPDYLAVIILLIAVLTVLACWCDRGSVWRSRASSRSCSKTG
jgi:hypothetical protein